MNNESLSPKIYVADLRAHNKGIRRGAWINANQSKENIQAEINKMLAKSPSVGTEEWAIYDHDDFPIRFDEYEDLDLVVAVAEVVAEHGKIGIEVIDNFNSDVAHSRRLFEECYQGAYRCKEDFASYMMNEGHDIPEHIEFYIDYEKYARDLFINDFFSIYLDGQYHVFRNL